MSNILDKMYKICVLLLRESSLVKRFDLVNSLLLRESTKMLQKSVTMLRF